MLSHHAGGVPFSVGVGRPLAESASCLEREPSDESGDPLGEVTFRQTVEFAAGIAVTREERIERDSRRLRCAGPTQRRLDHFEARVAVMALIPVEDGGRTVDAERILRLVVEVGVNPGTLDPIGHLDERKGLIEDRDRMMSEGGKLVRLTQPVGHFGRLDIPPVDRTTRFG